MACNNCYSFDSIPECTSELTLGIIDPLTDIYIYVKNTFTGYMHREEVTSDANGEIILDLTQPDPSFYNQDSSYEIWATLRTDSDLIEITVAYGIVDTCISVEFFKVNDTTEEI
jgi:hypothetical protein